jgi:FG-GAP-like repeat
MLSLRMTILLLMLPSAGPVAAEWQAIIVETPGRVTTVDVKDDDARIAIGKTWYRLDPAAGSLQQAAPFQHPKPPSGSLRDARVAVGRDIVARAWLADPTDRYQHGILGDSIEAGSLHIARRDGTQGALRLGADAVFEDIEPRIAMIGGSEKIVVVKSYLSRGSAVAIVDPRSATVVAETAPVGHPHAWVSPAGFADFDGDGTIDMALVRQPHVVGVMELWSWQHGRLVKSGEVADVSNHFVGSRSLHMNHVADFDGDGHPDIAVPDRERRTLRLIGFAPKSHDIARIVLPARVATNIGGLPVGDRAALVFGLEDGRLVLVRNR